MTRLMQKFVGISLAALLILLVAAPVALCTAHDCRACMDEKCRVCAVIEGDIGSLFRIFCTLPARDGIRAPILSAPEACARPYDGCALLPVALKVRMNN
ncbi:MAG: hypothetical protein ACOYI5_06865 [Christensenellales bacterium]